MTSRARVLVTGVGGFVGGHIALFLQKCGFAVSGLVHVNPPPGELRSIQVGSILDPHAMERAIARADIVVHAAGSAHGRHVDPATTWQVNLDGTRLLLETAHRNKVQRFIFISSAASVAETKTADVSARVRARRDQVYGESKRAAEELVRRYGDDGVPTVILRPPMIYGPGMKGNPARLLRLIQAGVPLPLAGIRNRRSVLFVGNLAEAVARCIESYRCLRHALFVTDGPPVSTPDFVRWLARGLGRPVRLFKVPRTVLEAGGMMASALDGVFPFPITRRSIEALIGDLVLDDTELRACVGYSGAITTRAAVEETGRSARIHDFAGD